MSQDLNEWGVPTQQTSSESTVTLEQMDALIVRLSDQRKKYEQAKKASAEEYHKLEEIEKEVMNTLKVNGRIKYEAEGVAAIHIQTKEVYTTPKTVDQKRQLFKYIQDKFGVEALTGLLSINHQSLNSFANKETEADPGLVIPGLDQPTSVETLYFRSK